MTYEIYRYIFFGGAALAVLMLLISVLLFFVYKIPHVVGDLTGANARKAIENIRNQNEISGDKLYKTSKVNRERGKLTDKISPSGRLIRNPTDLLGGGAMATEKIGTQNLQPIADETTVLDAGANETTVLDAGGNETTVLGVGANETTVLSAVEAPAQPESMVTFEIEYDITYIHTDEVIA